MVHQWGFFGSISAIRKIWSLTANSRSLQAAALKLSEPYSKPEVVVKQHNDVFKHILHAKQLKSVFSE